MGIIWRLWPVIMLGHESINKLISLISSKSKVLIAQESLELSKFHSRNSLTVILDVIQ